MTKTLTVVIALCLGVSGCTPQNVRTDLSDRRPLRRSLATFVPPPVPGRDTLVPREPNDITGELTLEQAVDLALRHNPRLAVFAWSVRAGQARQRQSGLRPNPELDIEWENIAGSGPFAGTDNAETTLGITQSIEWGDKRSKRTHLAGLNTTLARWDYESQRLAVLTQVTAAFVEVLATQEKIGVMEQQVALAEKVVQTTQQKVQAGSSVPLAAMQAHVSLTQEKIEQQRVQHDLITARQRLAELWGASRPVFTRVLGSLHQISPAPELSRLHNLLGQSPEVARWDNEIEQRQAAIHMEKAHAWPDPTLAAGYRRFSEVDESAFVLGLSLPLPIKNRNQGNIQAAQIALAQAYRQRRAAWIHAQTELIRSYSQLANAYTAAHDLQEAVLPGARAAFDSAQIGYQNGKFDYLTVLDTQRTLFAVRTQYLDTLVDYHQAKAQVEQLIGQSLESLGGQNHD